MSGYYFTTAISWSAVVNADLFPRNAFKQNGEPVFRIECDKPCKMAV